MFKLIKESFKITNSNIILTIPLIIFVKLLDLYSVYSRINLDTIPKFIVATITILVMFGIFCSMWFYMIKGAIENSKKVFVLDSDRTKASLNLFKKIPEGINKLFLPFSGIYIIFCIIQILLTPIVYLIGLKIISNLDTESLSNIQDLVLSSISESNSMIVLIDKMTPEQILFFAEWSILFMVLTSLIMYLLMLWIPEVVFNTKNPFFALFESITKLFRHFFSSLCLFSLLWFAGFILLFLNTFSMINPLIYFLTNVILFYFFLFVAICIFTYYDKRFCKDEE